MLFIIIILGAAIGLIIWNTFVEKNSRLDIKIPASKNIYFNSESPIAMTTTQIANELEKHDGKPIVFYLYTTWCESCNKNFINFNEIAQEFQETDLRIIALAIDRNLSESSLQEYLNRHGNIYFYPRFLSFKEGFKDFLKQKGINYDGRIPFTILLGRDGEVITKYSGVKNKNYLRNKIIEELYAI